MTGPFQRVVSVDQVHRRRTQHLLQVLEQVLRTGDRPTVRAVADRISAKIGYDRGMAADSEFLRAYYHGVRERLESRLLMGRRRKDKFDAA